MNTWRKRPGLFGLCMLIAAQAALAQSADAPKKGYYSCTDANGRVINSDKPIYECLNREQREHNADGTVRRVIDAPLTPAQRKAREAEELRKQQEETRLAEQRRVDRILLSSYSGVQGIEQARKRALTEPESGIQKSNERLTELGKERETLQSETEFYAKRKMPIELERKIADNEAAQKYERDLLARRALEIQRINDRFAADKARYLELTDGPPPDRKSGSALDR